MAAESKRGRSPKPPGRYGELRLYKRVEGREIDREPLDKPDEFRPAFDRLLDRNPSATDVIVEFVLNWSGLNDFLNTTWRELTTSDIESYLAGELKARVSSSNYEQFLQHGLQIPDEGSRRTVRKAIDEIILQAAVQQGPNIFLVPVVRQRLTDWALKEEDGSKHWEELGKSFAQLAHVVQGKAMAPLYPWWVRSRKDVLVELKALRKYLLAQRVTHRNPSRDELLNEVRYTIEVHQEKFPKLLRIGVSFLAFVQSESDAFRGFLGKQPSPADFTDRLISWMTNYKPDSARQKISDYLSSHNKKGS